MVLPTKTLSRTQILLPEILPFACSSFARRKNGRSRENAGRSSASVSRSSLNSEMFQSRGSSSFQRLALWTTATTYFLILVGGLVRASGAGLGCPDWPRCFGAWVPPASAAELPPQFDASLFNPTLMWTEYLN